MVTGIGNFFLAAAPIHPGRDRATPTTPFEIDGATQVWHSSARYAQSSASLSQLLAMSIKMSRTRGLGARSDI